MSMGLVKANSTWLGLVKWEDWLNGQEQRMSFLNFRQAFDVISYAASL